MPRLTGPAVTYSVVTHHPRVAADYLVFAFCRAGAWCGFPGGLRQPPAAVGALPEGPGRRLWLAGARQGASSRRLGCVWPWGRAAR